MDKCCLYLKNAAVKNNTVYINLKQKIARTFGLLLLLVISAVLAQNANAFAYKSQSTGWAPNADIYVQNPFYQDNGTTPDPFGAAPDGPWYSGIFENPGNEFNVTQNNDGSGRFLDVKLTGAAATNTYTIVRAVAKWIENPGFSNFGLYCNRTVVLPEGKVFINAGGKTYQMINTGNYQFEATIPWATAVNIYGLNANIGGGNVTAITAENGMNLQLGNGVPTTMQLNINATNVAGTGSVTVKFDLWTNKVTFTQCTIKEVYGSKWVNNATGAALTVLTSLTTGQAYSTSYGNGLFEAWISNTNSAAAPTNGVSGYLSGTTASTTTVTPPMCTNPCANLLVESDANFLVYPTNSVSNASYYIQWTKVNGGSGGNAKITLIAGPGPLNGSNAGTLAVTRNTNTTPITATTPNIVWGNDVGVLSTRTQTMVVSAGATNTVRINRAAQNCNIIGFIIEYDCPIECEYADNKVIKVNNKATDTICQGAIPTVTVISTQSGVIYSLFDHNGTKLGNDITGNGSNMNFTGLTAFNTLGTTTLVVKTSTANNTICTDMVVGTVDITVKDCCTPPNPLTNVTVSPNPV